MRAKPWLLRPRSMMLGPVERARKMRSAVGIGIVLCVIMVMHATRKCYRASGTMSMRSQERSSCCMMCTTPKNTRCLRCDDVSSSREHDLLMAMMEGLTHHIMQMHSSERHEWLLTRAWEGNSHIGNRKVQATFYYDWARSLSIDGDGAKHVCEIGMNGGHSALVFLAALAPRDGVKLTMFDLEGFDYSQTAKKYIETLYPPQFALHTGDSRETVPNWMNEGEKEKCDVFSVDGDHAFEGARADILNAAKATRKGGKIILDDMNQGGPTRQAFDSALEAGVIADAKCVEDVEVQVGHEDRASTKDARNLMMSWCMATVV